MRRVSNCTLAAEWLALERHNLSAPLDLLTQRQSLHHFGHVIGQSSAFTSRASSSIDLESISSRACSSMYCLEFQWQTENKDIAIAGGVQNRLG